MSVRSKVALAAAEPLQLPVIVSAQLFSPRGLAVDVAGNLFIADGDRVREVSSDGIITTVSNTVAGEGTVSKVCVAGSSGAQLCSPSNIAVDPSGNLLITGSGFTDDSDGGYFTNFVVLKLFPDGNITMVASTDARAVRRQRYRGG